MPYLVTTLTQLPPETAAAFEIRVQTFVNDQYYYFTAASGALPAPPASSSSFIGYPPIEPTSDSFAWDVTAAQFVRVVSFSYQNDYYYKFIGASPPLPPPSPFPTAGNMAIWGAVGQVLDSGLGFNIPSMNFTNLSPATVNGQAVEYSQFAALAAGVVATVNAVAPTLGNIQLTVSNTGTAGTLQWLGLALQIPQADTDTTGLLGFTDWNTFNTKQPAGSYITALTGDVSAAGPGSVAATLATVNATPGSFGDATTVPVITCNVKGLITNVVSFTIMPPESNITFTDITTNNSSAAAHGFLKKLSGAATDYMDGTGNWSVPVGLGGTVTSFSSGALSPLFTTSVATPTTTPALSFTLSNAAASTWFGNNSAIGSAAPAFNAQAALTKVDDTNVTLTLGGTPTLALMNAVSLTLGWTGVLSVARGGVSQDWIDWSASVNPTGFSSVTVNQCYYNIISPKVLFFIFNWSGTSNATTMTCTLPVAYANITAIILPVRNADSGTGSIGTVTTTTNSTTLTFGKSQTGTTGGFTALGTKSSTGCFLIFTV